MHFRLHFKQSYMFEVNYERARSLIAEQTQPSRNKCCWYFWLFYLKAPNDALENWHSCFVFPRFRFQISFSTLVMLVSVSRLPARSGDFCSPKCPDLLWGPPNLQFNGKPGILPRLKWRLCHECNHPPEFSAYLKMSRAVPPLRRAPSWRLQGQIYYYLWSPENFLDSA